MKREVKVHKADLECRGVAKRTGRIDLPYSVPLPHRTRSSWSWGVGRGRKEASPLGAVLIAWSFGVEGTFTPVIDLIIFSLDLDNVSA